MGEFKGEIKMNKNEYNGWYNYETWLCALWLQNDSGSCLYWEDVTNECDDVADLARAIEDEINGINPVSDTSLYADLMSAAISEINFSEIAHHFWDDYRDPKIDMIPGIVNDLIELYDADKNDPENMTEEGYIRVFWTQEWIPELIDRIAGQLEEKSDLWLETGDDPTDIYVCGNV